MNGTTTFSTAKRYIRRSEVIGLAVEDMCARGDGVPSAAESQNRDDFILGGFYDNDVFVLLSPWKWR